jgi:hypothetical protein
LGDSQYIVPKEKADYENAQKICGTRDMGLASLESLAETDLVKDYLGSLGLSSHNVLTSLKKTGIDTYNWFGGVTAQTLEWASDPSAVTEGKDCAGLSTLGLSPISCDTLSTFVCESKDPNAEKTTT